MWRSVFSSMLPARMLEAVRARRLERRYRGNFASWAEAQRASTGYASAKILQRVIAATRATRAGEAAWERDTVLFSEPWVHEPLLRVMQDVAAREGGLDVLDFGGALGSTWWQHRERFDAAELTRWSVVEQPEFVAVGRREFQQGPLKFYPDIAECLAVGPPNVTLLSSVLPYLEQPHVWLRELGAKVTGTLIIDRTGFVRGGEDRLAVQHVPESVYDASYPCWFFSQPQLLASLGPAWELKQEWSSFDGDGQTFRYRGLVLAHRTNQL